MSTLTPTWTDRRDTEWSPHDPNRRCFGCGSLPVAKFPDGSPKYSCRPHPVIVASASDVARYAAQRPLVTLTEDMVDQARRHAARVQAAAKRNRQGDRFAPAGDRLEQDVRAFAAELAVAEYLGLPWNDDVLSRAQLRRGKQADVGENIEVRTWPETRRDGLFLPVRDGDKTDRVCVLAVGRVPAFTLIGWAIAGSVMTKAYRYDDRRHHPYWRVPIDALRLFPMPTDLIR